MVTYHLKGTFSNLALFFFQKYTCVFSKEESFFSEDQWIPFKNKKGCRLPFQVEQQPEMSKPQIS